MKGPVQLTHSFIQMCTHFPCETGKECECEKGIFSEDGAKGEEKEMMNGRWLKKGGN